jgi:membrane glycosyltransferase
MNILSSDFLSILITALGFTLYIGRKICQEALVLLPEEIRKRGRP